MNVTQKPKSGNQPAGNPAAPGIEQTGSTMPPERRIESNYQNIFLAQLKRAQIPVSIYFFGEDDPVKGIIRGYDNFVLIIDRDDSRQQLLYKHALSAIVPLKAVSLKPPEVAS